MSNIPSDAPPAYDEAVGNGASSSSAGGSSSNTLHLPRNGISAQARRSMEDESRPLPNGWIRQYDAEQSHHFYVDTRAKPPRSIWHHPYDDEDYLSTLSGAERERLQEEHRHPSMPDIVAMSSDDEDDEHHHDPLRKLKGEDDGAALPQRPADGKKGFGRKLKNKLTGTTHEQREFERKKRTEQEKAAYERHQKYRQAMQQANQTGEPQFIGKDKNNKDVYIEPASFQGPYGGYGTGGGVNSNRRRDPNAVYITPQQPQMAYGRPYGSYGRPYGYGYGGGYGLPLAGGLMGGLLIGDMMGGGMGMGMGGMGMGMGGMGMGGMGM